MARSGVKRSREGSCEIRLLKSRLTRVPSIRGITDDFVNDQGGLFARGELNPVTGEGGGRLDGAIGRLDLVPTLPHVCRVVDVERWMWEESTRVVSDRVDGPLRIAVSDLCADQSGLAAWARQHSFQQIGDGEAFRGAHLLHVL